MTKTRASGILLHPTSLPGRWGIGELGEAAYRFIDFLSATGQRLWQVMPLGPTGYGDSPYASFSAFAGNPLLISIDRLRDAGLLSERDLDDAPQFSRTRVEYGTVQQWKLPMLRRSFERFTAAAGAEQQRLFSDFCVRNRSWLDDYVLFAAIKDAHGGIAWNAWPADIAQRQPQAIVQWTERVREQIAFYSYLQFQFFSQWQDLKRYANARGVRIIGDIPIFVAYDSADVWANPELFDLLPDGSPNSVAGVPPDYFSATGQLWGNPLYRWDVLARQGYAWWIERFRTTLTFVDILRLDHFRGFAAYWAVPAGEETAINGQWLPGPGAALFNALDEALGGLPIIAEDLGLITPDVELLRDQFGFPGMKVLQFAFGGDVDDGYLPHNYEKQCVVYTGTHDNDTTVGWWATATPAERTLVQLYVGRDGSDIGWDLIRLALASVAETAIIPLQDILGLGTTARMNTPGSPGGNWTWRYQDDMITSTIAERLALMTRLYGRFQAVVRPTAATE